jgi:hypothetical protein
MMDMFEVLGFARSRSTTSKPSMRGIITSISARSGRSAVARSRASAPSEAIPTS